MRTKLKELLEIIDFDAIVEIYDRHTNLIVKAPADELLLNDVGLWEQEVMIICPQHNQREDYLEITLY